MRGSSFVASSARRLKGMLLPLAVSMLALSAVGCDDPKKETPTAPSATPSAVVSAVPSAQASAAPLASASAEPPKAKAPVVCSTGPDLDTKDSPTRFDENCRKSRAKP